MNHRRKQLLLITAATLNLSACGYIQSLFPDKEKDYQYTTEIPPLVLPDDLKAGAAADAVEEPSLQHAEAVKEGSQPASAETEPQEKAPEDAAKGTETAGAEAKSEQPEAQSEASGQAAPEEPPEVKAEKKDAQQEGTPVELVRFSDGERRLRIASSPDKAWHLVSKALSRNSIEVTQRDQTQKLFFVQYDPEARKAEDGSLLDEAIFLFKGFETREKAYLLKLIAVDDKTDLAITDKDWNPVPDDEAAVKLLRLLGGTIQGK
ncbi:outer membrane protein assembly factor BamC [Methylomicrobium lacus]|uniref:outer membrane protein assembly factor BamC n=1 Tax=Methylomicrobium lacus TaxID=136992 RepID=UPI0035A8A9E6